MQKLVAEARITWNGEKLYEEMQSELASLLQSASGLQKAHSMMASVEAMLTLHEENPEQDIS